MNILIAGGGTGGHLFPALAIGAEWRRRHPDSSIHYVGSSFGIEAEILPSQDTPFTLLPIRGLQRGLSLTALGRNLLLPIRLIRSWVKTRRLFKRFSPAVVIGTGGYASALPVHEALSKNIPVVLQEQNSFPGLTTRMYADQVEKICLGFEAAEDFLQKKNFVYTGNPVRNQEFRGDRMVAAERFNLDGNQPTLFITGGSQGSAYLNQQISGLLEAGIPDDIQCLWQVGESQYDAYRKFNSSTVRVVPFINAMEDAYSLADVVISRAGALALAEIACWGKPGILVPLASAAGNHQKKNAETLVRSGAAVMIEESEMKPGLLAAELEKIIKDEARRDSMCAAALKISRPQATRDIVAEIEKVVFK